MNFITNLIGGLSLGGIYAMIALGYTMVYGIAKMLNFAHGDIIMVGGYTILVFTAQSVHPLIAIALAIVFCVGLGVVVERVAYKPLRGASPLAVLITAIGVSYLLQSLAQMFFGSGTKMVTGLDLGSFNIGSLKISVSTIVTLLSCIAVMVALNLFVKYTKTGRAMIAVSEDKGAAQLMGINVNLIIMITFAIGSALAALAGTFYLMRSPSIYSTFGSLPRYQGVLRCGYWWYRLNSRRYAWRYFARRCRGFRKLCISYCTIHRRYRVCNTHYNIAG